MSEPDGNDDLKRRKLELEIRALRNPFQSNPALWISCATAIAALLFGVFSLRYSRNEWVLSQIEKKQAEQETQTLKSQNQTLAAENKDLTSQKETLSAEIQTMSNQRAELTSLLQNADSLLGRAQTTTDPNLRSDIDKLRQTTNPTSSFWSSLLSEANKPEMKEAAQFDRALRDAIQQLMNAYRNISEKELSGFQMSQTGAGPQKKRYDIDLAFVRPGYRQPKLYTKYVIRVEGTNLQFVFLDGEKEKPFYVTSVDHPTYGQDFEEAVKGAAAAQLKAELERSD
jgi:hypothetical protein